MTRPPTILPGMVDREHTRNGPRRWRGEVLLYTPTPVVIAVVHGRTLTEVRARKRAVYEALKATAAAAAQPGGG